MTEKEQTAPISARIPLTLFAEIHAELRETKQTMSEFIREAAEDKLLNENKEALDAEVKYMEKKLEILKARKDQLKEKKKEMNKIPEAEIPFLKETKEILLKNPTFTKGRIKLYQNRFNKHYRISEQEFWKLLDKV